jgi:hypothetical protein
MRQTEHEGIVQQIADNVSQAGYQITVAPSRAPNRGLKHKLDLLVQSGPNLRK